MTRQEDCNGLHVRLIEARVIDGSDVAGAFRRGIVVGLELDDRQRVNITRGDGKVVIARLRDGAETVAIIRHLQAGNLLAGTIEDAIIEPGFTVLRIRLDY